MDGGRGRIGGKYGAGEMVREGIKEVEAADDPKATFEEVFESWINYWEDKFDELDDRKVPKEDKETIIDLLVDVLKERAGID